MQYPQQDLYTCPSVVGGVASLVHMKFSQDHVHIE